MIQILNISLDCILITYIFRGGRNVIAKILNQPEHINNQPTRDKYQT